MVPADSPGTLTGNCFGIWVEQNFIFVKEQSFFRTVWSVYTVGIFKFINVQSIYDHGINITDLVSFRKRKYSKRFFLCTVEQKQFTGGSSACVNGKINTKIPCFCRMKKQKPTGRTGKPAISAIGEDS